MISRNPFSGPVNRELAVWLQGFITAIGDGPPTPEQWQVIKERVEREYSYDVAHRLTSSDNLTYHTYTFDSSAR